MLYSDSDLLSIVTLLTPATFVVAITIAVLRRNNSISNNSISNNSTDNTSRGTKTKLSLSSSPLPTADAGIFETLRELAGDRTPSWMLEQARKLGSYSYRLPISMSGVFEMVVIGDASLGRSILLDPRNEKALDLLKTFEITLGGTCMFTQPNDLAKTTRQKMSRAFGPGLVKGRMATVCKRRIEAWVETVLEPTIESGGTIDPCREMLDVAFKIVCEVVFDYDATREECELFLDHGEVTAVEFGFKQMMNPLRPILGRWLAERDRAFESVRWIQSFGLKMLEEHQRKKKMTKEPSSIPTTVISLIDDDPRYPSNKEKLPELLLWLFAGHDTVGFSMGTALYHLAQNPSELTKVRTALLRRDTDTADAARSLREVQNVIRESHRLLPVTANISIRKLGTDTVTPDGLSTIPKGATVFLPQYLPNHDHRIFEDPSTFRPDRWNTPSKEMLESSMPFSVGPRSCPGLALARVEMDSILPVLIRDYDFEVVQEGEPKFFITLKPVGVLLRPKHAATKGSENKQ